jgi:hypothetical protein
MKTLFATAALCAASLGCFAQSNEIRGLTFSVTTDTDYYRPPPFQYGYVTRDRATAGMWGSQAEWIAARSEFDLTGQQAAGSVVLSFQAVSVTRRHDFAPALIRVGTYAGNNLAELNDFTPTWQGALPGIDLATFAAGTLYTFDVTALYNAAIARGDFAFGVGIDNREFADTFAAFDGFTLAVAAVPEPQTWALMLAGGAALGLGRLARRRMAGPTLTM